jgi:hypothetical protein
MRNDAVYPSRCQFTSGGEFICRGEFIRQADRRSACRNQAAALIYLTPTLSQRERGFVRCRPELPVGASSFAKPVTCLTDKEQP